MPFLRCFGAKISHLDVNYNKHELDGNDYVDRYVNQYCAETLKSISFLNKSSTFFNMNFPKPFKCVEKVLIGVVDLGAHLPHFVNLFPMMRELIMLRISTAQNINNVHFPNLKDLCDWVDRLGGFTIKKVMILLHSNPQLEKLQLENVLDNQELTMNEILNTISENPSITKLYVRNANKTNISQVDLKRFAFERSFTTKLALSSLPIKPQDAVVFIRQLKSLKMFRFLINDQADYVLLMNQLDSEWKHEHDIRFNGYQLITLKR